MGLGAVAYGRSEQLVFDFGRAPLQPPRPKTRQVSHNLYFAVLPAAEAARRMTEVGAKLRNRYGLPGRVQPDRLLHVSLAHVGHYAGLPESVVATARRAGSAVRCAPFEVRFNRAVSFDNPRGAPLVLRCGRGEAGFAHLRRAITVAMARCGFCPDRTIGLTPHVTLVYDGLVVHPSMLDEPITWTVREFVLVHSLYGRGRHIHLDRWPLQG